MHVYIMRLKRRDFGRYARIHHETKRRDFGRYARIHHETKRRDFGRLWQNFGERSHESEAWSVEPKPTFPAPFSFLATTALSVLRSLDDGTRDSSSTKPLLLKLLFGRFLGSLSLICGLAGACSWKVLM